MQPSGGASGGEAASGREVVKAQRMLEAMSLQVRTFQQMNKYTASQLLKIVGFCRKKILKF